MAKKSSFGRDWDKLARVGGTAPLHENGSADLNPVNPAVEQTAAPTLAESEQPTAPAPTAAEPEQPVAPKTRSKSLGNIPVEFFEAHQRLYTKKVTMLKFSAYIIEALAEKLERDGVISRSLDD